VLPASHVVPLQQPVEQDDALHTHAPPTHAWPVMQATQAAPSVPHWPAVLPASHVVPLQQPVGQSAAAQ
jgi:hypothetical protein